MDMNNSLELTFNSTEYLQAFKNSTSYGELKEYLVTVTQSFFVDIIF